MTTTRHDGQQPPPVAGARVSGPARADLPGTVPADSPTAPQSAGRVDGNRGVTEGVLAGRVLRAVADVARSRYAAVTWDEVLRHARPGALDGVDPRDGQRWLATLVSQRQLTRVVPARAVGLGAARYLPRDLDASVYRDSLSATVREAVLAAFRVLWDERDRAARLAPTYRVRPPSTAEVATRMTALWPDLVVAARPLRRVVGATLDRAAGYPGAPLRRVRSAAHGRPYWTPADVPDTHLDVHAGRDNGARIREAVRRAEARRQLPVRRDDVWDETQADLTLRLRSRQEFTATLAHESRPYGRDATKEVLGGRPIHRVGTYAGEVLYTAGDPARGRAYVEILHLRRAWGDARAVDRIEALGGVTLPSVTLGRARLVSADLDRVSESAKRLVDDGAADPTVRLAANGILVAARDAREALRPFLRTGARASGSTARPSDGPLPDHPDERADYWTPAEAAVALATVLPELSVNGDARASTLKRLYLRVQRAPNPVCLGRRPKPAWASGAVLLQRTDTLLYGALWAGCECATQAAIARHELDRLRDPRFILPGLASPRYVERLAAVACAAFCWSTAGTVALASLAREDVDPGVRQAAAWAFGFAGGSGAVALLQTLADNDSSGQVRAFARRALTSVERHTGGWWLV